jgi:miniconductance mechanosensitive channel
MLERFLQSWYHYEGLIGLACVAVLSYILFQWIGSPLLHRHVVRMHERIGILMFENNVLSRLALLVPAILVEAGLPYVLHPETDLYSLLFRAANVYLICTSYAFLASLVSLLSATLRNDPQNGRKPVHGLLQALKLVGFLVCVVLVLAQITQKDPLFLLSGLGALAAVFMLVFKDSILGLVAGIQLTTFDLVRTGDWIEIPKHNADGDVVDVSLTSVSIRNFDKTISVVPAYELVSSSFRNWRGMFESGGRRIKRSLSIDARSVHFLSSEEIQSLLQVKLLRSYLESRMREIDEFNQKVLVPEDFSVLANGRRLTNLGTFRAYCEAYLKAHPKIHHEGMTLLVRHLQPTEKGIPVEIYCFTNDTNWNHYESIQADIFDHLIAVLPEFHLKLFQELSNL